MFHYMLLQLYESAVHYFYIRTGFSLYALECRCSFVCEYSAIILYSPCFAGPFTSSLHMVYLGWCIYSKLLNIVTGELYIHSFVCAQHHSLILCALKVISIIVKHTSLEYYLYVGVTHVSTAFSVFYTPM